jgi:3-oxoacyl-(acyl-carrier-protein) synthase
MADVQRDEAIAVTGMGMVTAQGVGVCASWDGVVNGREVLRGWEAVAGHALGKLPVGVCPELARPGDLPLRLWKGLSRTQQLAAVAADEALLQAGLGRRVESARTGMFLATTVCGMDVSERFYAQYREDKDSADVELMRRLQPAEVEHLLWRRHGIGASGLRNVCLSTCVGSAAAIGAAMDAINLGECDVAMAGGSEALCRVVLSGFHSLKVVAAGGCRPFDKDRPGMTVGEGAGILILESVAHARARGAKVLGYLRGFGATCDAHHITAPDPEGVQASRAISEALARAGVSAEEVDYGNAHGTGTRDNDAMEAKAIERVFGDKIPPVSSTKRATGHTFGAAGVVEAIFCLQAIQEGIVLGNWGSVEGDTALWKGRDPVVRRGSYRGNVNVAVSLNFAFGGNNTALVFSREAGHG